MFDRESASAVRPEGKRALWIEKFVNRAPISALIPHLYDSGKVTPCHLRNEEGLGTRDSGCLEQPIGGAHLWSKSLT